MKTLKHTIKKKWFDMILSGEKKEEYKEIKPFWLSRLFYIPNDYPFDTEPTSREDCCESIEETGTCELFPKPYSEHRFFNGRCLSDKYKNFKIEAKGIRIGTGKTEWGAVEGINYFIIELGEVIK